MTKGTQSFGRRHTKSHLPCPRCGRRAFHLQKRVCAACAYPAAKFRKYSGWSNKARRRKTTGVGRCRYLKLAKRREKNGFQTGLAPKKVQATQA